MTRLLFGLLCAHSWTPVGELKRGDDLVGVVQRCQHCGKLKKDMLL